MPILEPAPDFSDPLGLLAACHGRIRERCDTLARLPGHLNEHGADAPARRAAARIVAYFETAGRDHHADEDLDLFPLLRRRAAAGGGAQMLALLDGLGAEHAVLDRLWQGLRPALERIREGSAPRGLALAVEPLVRAYGEHLAREERHVLPYARRALTRDELRELGVRMARRRGVSWPCA